MFEDIVNALPLVVGVVVFATVSFVVVRWLNRVDAARRIVEEESEGGNARSSWHEKTDPTAGPARPNDL